MSMYVYEIGLSKPAVCRVCVYIYHMYASLTHPSVEALFRQLMQLARSYHDAAFCL